MAGTKNEGCLPKDNAASGTGKAGAAGRAARGRKTASGSGQVGAAAGVGVSAGARDVTNSDGSSGKSSVSSATGGGESATAKSEKQGKNLYEYLDSFASAVENSAPVNAINGATNKINSVDCGDVVYQFMVDNVPYFKQAVNLLNKGVNFMNGLSTGISLSTTMAGSDFVQKICDMLSKIFGTIDGYVEITTKAAFVVFKRIDAMLERLENTLMNLTEAVKNCILDVFRDLAAYLKKALNLGLNIDWSSLISLMQDCPCVARVIAALTGCQEDDAGNNIRNNPAAIVLCIQDKFPFLTPVNLTTAVDAVYNDYIKRYIEMAFGYIESWIAYVYNKMIKPFRCLMKKYAEMLLYKVDVTGFINSLGSFSCFLVYSEEYKKGKKFYGMSIIDMINTYRQWIPCFQHACPSFSEKVKTRSQEIYKDLRLDDKYWRSAYAIDIYMMCINAPLEGLSPRDSTLRSMYPESPIDLINSWFKSSKNNKKEADGEVSGMDNAVASVEEMEAYQKQNSGRLPPNSPDPLSNIVALDGKIDTENSPNQGDDAIDINAENAIVAMMENMHAAGEAYYVEKFYQLIRLMGSYSTSSKFIDKANELLSTIEAVDTTYRYTGDYMQLDSGRSDVDFDDPETVASYTLEDDYDEKRVARLSSPTAFAGYTEKRGTRQAHYARRYSVLAG